LDPRRLRRPRGSSDMTLTSIGSGTPSNPSPHKAHPSLLLAFPLEGQALPGHTRGRSEDLSLSRASGPCFPVRGSFACRFQVTPILARSFVRLRRPIPLHIWSLAERSGRVQQCYRTATSSMRRFGLRGESDRHVGRALGVCLNNVVAPRHFAGDVLRSGGFRQNLVPEDGFDIRCGSIHDDEAPNVDPGQASAGRPFRRSAWLRTPTMPDQRKSLSARQDSCSEIVQDCEMGSGTQSRTVIRIRTARVATQLKQSPAQGFADLPLA